MVCYLIPWLNLNKMQLYPVRRPLKSPPELLCQADSLVTRKAALERGGITELICKIVGLDTSQRMLMIFHSLFYSRVCVWGGGGKSPVKARDSNRTSDQTTQELLSVPRNNLGGVYGEKLILLWQQ